MQGIAAGLRCPLCLVRERTVHVDSSTIGCTACESLMPAEWVRSWTYGQRTAPYLDGYMRRPQLEAQRTIRRVSAIEARNRRGGAVRCEAAQRDENGRFQKKNCAPPLASSEEPEMNRP